MLRMAKASLHVKRHLEPSERATIAAALEHFTIALSIEQQLELLAPYHDDAMPLSPDDARALAKEIITARKVKVCRSKQRES